MLNYKKINNKKVNLIKKMLNYKKIYYKKVNLIIKKINYKKGKLLSDSEYLFMNSLWPLGIAIPEYEQPVFC